MIAIRTGTSADCDVIVALEQRGFADESDYFNQITQAEVVAAMQTDTYLVCVDDKAGLIGSVCIYRSPLEDGSRRVGELVVEPTMRGNGYGPRLMDAAEQHLRLDGCKKITIGVLNFKSEKTFMLYRNRGYKETGQRPSPIPRPKRPCHLILMSKAL